MIKGWHPTDMLRAKHGGSIQVQRLKAIGTGNTEKGTAQDVVYWQVLTSPRYANRTGIHLITMVPETRLRPIAKKAENSCDV